MDATVGNKKMAGTCTSDHAQLEYNSHKLLCNLLAAILLPKSLDLAILSLYTQLGVNPELCMDLSFATSRLQILPTLWHVKRCIIQFLHVNICNVEMYM